MPRRELKDPRQVEDWLVDFGSRLSQPAGSGETSRATARIKPGHGAWA